PLTDLRVVKVQVQPQPWTADGLDERDGVRGARKRNARVIDRRVEVLQTEGDAAALAQLGDLVQRSTRSQPHRAGHLVRRLHGQSAAVEAGAVQVQARAAKPMRGPDRLLCRAQELLRAIIVHQGAPDVARHVRERRARAYQGIDVSGRPVPDLYLESKLGDPAHPLLEGELAKDHL